MFHSEGREIKTEREREGGRESETSDTKSTVRRIVCLSVVMTSSRNAWEVDWPGVRACFSNAYLPGVRTANDRAVIVSLPPYLFRAVCMPQASSANFVFSSYSLPLYTYFLRVVADSLCRRGVKKKADRIFIYYLFENLLVFTYRVNNFKVGF